MKIVKLQSSDGELFEIDSETVSMCTTVKNMLRGKSAFRNSLGGQFSIDGSYVILKKEGRVLATLLKNNDEEAIITLPDVKAVTLEKVLEYCKYHTAPDITERERKNWDTEFVQVKQSVLCELASASYYLDIKPLVNLTSRAIATQISGKTSEEIRETFCNINYEVYAPVFATSLATRCRLQRKINQKKLTKEQNKALMAPENDTRSLDDLLSFIDGGNNSGSPMTQLKKKAKKSTNKKNKKKGDSNGEDDRSDTLSKTDSTEDIPSPSPSTDEDEDDEDSYGIEPHNPEFWEEPEDEEEDELDPEKKAALDKEVEEFRQRLESMNSKNDAPKAKIQLPVSASTFVSSLVGVH